MFSTILERTFSLHLLFGRLAYLTTLGLLLSCSSLVLAQDGMPKKEATKLVLQLEADALVNKGANGQAFPIQVKIFELKDASAFESLDYFALMENEKVALAADLLNKYEYVLKPSQKVLIERKSNTQTTAIGVVAGYKDLVNAEWRVLIPLKEAPEAAWYRLLLPASKLKAKILFKDKGISVVTD